MNCKSCGAAILWVTTEGGKNMPLDAKPEKRVILVPRTDDEHRRAR